VSEEDVADLFRPVLAVASRRMFGGLGIYDGGCMFALMTGGELFMKADAGTRVTFETAGSSPFVYAGGAGPVTTSYWRLPPAAFDDEGEFRRWTALARDAAIRAASRPTRRRRSRPSARPDDLRG